MHRYRIGILLILVSSSLHTWAQVLTLDSCYNKARRNYPLIKQHGLIEKSTEYTISNANKAYLRRAPRLKKINFN